MFYAEEKPKQEKRSVSYGGYEKQKLFDLIWNPHSWNTMDTTTLNWSNHS